MSIDDHHREPSSVQGGRKNKRFFFQKNTKQTRQQGRQKTRTNDAVATLKNKQKYETRARAHTQINGNTHATHLCPEPVLELLFGGPERLDVVELVQVGQHAHHLGKPVHLQHIQELERLHLETEAKIDANRANRGGGGHKQAGRKDGGMYVRKRRERSCVPPSKAGQVLRCLRRLSVTATVSSEKIYPEPWISVRRKFSPPSTYAPPQSMIVICGERGYSTVAAPSKETEISAGAEFSVLSPT